MKAHFSHILFLVAFFIASHHLMSQTADLPSGKFSDGSFQVNELSYFFSSSDPGIQNIRKLPSKNFIPVNQEPFNGGISKGYYWFKFNISNTGVSNNTAYINVQNSRLNELHLYEVRGDTLLSLGKYGDFFNFANRKYSYKNFVFSTTIPANSTREYYLYANQVGHAFILPLKVYNLKDIQSKILSDYLLEGIALGILIYSIMFSLFYWIARKEKIYLTYSLYILSAIGWIISYFGLGFEMIWPESPWFNTAAAPFFSGLHMALNIHLCQVLLHIRNLSRTLHICCNGIKILLLIVAIAPVLTPLDNYGYQENYVFLISFLLVIILSVIVILFSIISSLNATPTGKYYLYASLVKVSGIINLALMELGLTPAMFHLEQLMVGGLLIEIFLLSFGLAKRSQLQKIQLRKQKLLAREMEMNLQKELLKAQLEIQEQTLKSIGQEIHDNIGQMLTLLKLNLENIKDNVSKEAGVAISDAQEILRNIIQDLRNMSKTLNNDMLARMGLVSTIEMELKVINRASGMNTFLDWEQDIPPLNKQVELIIFRLIQEALHNILKHAHASEIKVSGRLEDGQLVITVKDDGRGFDHESTTGTGSGLLNLDNRCKLINACLSINSSNGNGTEIRITCPLDAPPIAPSYTGAVSIN
ncbi:sensor histidine kinase [Aridibaculum aurantiacum]|uniref:sensor histidine kinase n=1 Tax=Aridibaculum aurantiacum TaxID=2810307 RepID=UPI001A978A94|nr:7TM diverse intracellular signaling domain-containing protein [Aridibaculum aurantiacum]